MTRTLFGTDIPDPTAPDRDGTPLEVLPYTPPSLEFVEFITCMDDVRAHVAGSLAPEYREIRTPVPPVLAFEDGKLVVKLTHGNMTMIAGIGDGAWFFHQLVEKLVDPALRAYRMAAREPGSPND